MLPSEKPLSLQQYRHGHFQNRMKIHFRPYMFFTVIFDNRDVFIIRGGFNTFSGKLAIFL